MAQCCTQSKTKIALSINRLFVGNYDKFFLEANLTNYSPSWPRRHTHHHQNDQHHGFVWGSKVVSVCIWILRSWSYKTIIWTSMWREFIVDNLCESIGTESFTWTISANIIRTIVLIMKNVIYSGDVNIVMKYICICSSNPGNTYL